jgi:hypothetical protein
VAVEELGVVPDVAQTEVAIRGLADGISLRQNTSENFWITIVSGVLGLACTLILRDRPLRTASELRASAGLTGGDGLVAAELAHVTSSSAGGPGQAV